VTSFLSRAYGTLSSLSAFTTCFFFKFDGLEYLTVNEEDDELSCVIGKSDGDCI